jgi:hypothetical protein
LELAYCAPQGIPHSEFLSWSADDQDKALAWLADQSNRCPDCRTRPEEWDPAQGGSRTAYVADVTRCLGCEVLGQARRDLNQMPEEHLGVHLALTPNDDSDEQEG